MTYIAPRFYKWGMRKTQFGELTSNNVEFDESQLTGEGAR